MSKKKADNYLDYIPVHNKEFKVEDGKVTILRENKGLSNFVAQKFAKKPRVTQVHLDKMGNFIWPLIDGERSIYDISVLVKEKFGDDCEPLYERLIMYMRNLENYDFIKIEKTGKKCEKTN